VICEITLHQCFVLYEPRPYPPQQCDGLAAFGTLKENSYSFFDTRKTSKKKYSLHDAQSNVANICFFSG